MNVFVIGGLGFVGSAICHELNAYENVNLIVLDDESKGSVDNIQGVQCSIEIVDIRDKEAIHRVFEQRLPEVVIHLAAMHFIPECNENPSGCLMTNVIGTEHVLQAAAQANSLRRMIVTSSQAVYPINDFPNKETDTPSPYDVYGESKLTNEFQAARYHRKTGVDTVVVRLSNVYGPRETNPHVIPEIVSQIRSGQNRVSLGNIMPRRDFIHTSDVARAYAKLAFDEISKGYHVVNLGSGVEYSVQEILLKMSEIIGRDIIYQKDPSRFRHTERMHLVADIAEIGRLVNWTPEMSIDDGLRDLCAWYGLI